MASRGLIIWYWFWGASDRGEALNEVYSEPSNYNFYTPCMFFYSLYFYITIFFLMFVKIICKLIVYTKSMREHMKSNNGVVNG